VDDLNKIGLSGTVAVPGLRAGRHPCCSITLINWKTISVAAGISLGTFLEQLQPAADLAVIQLRREQPDR